MCVGLSVTTMSINTTLMNRGKPRERQHMFVDVDVTNHNTPLTWLPCRTSHHAWRSMCMGNCRMTHHRRGVHLHRVPYEAHDMHIQINICVWMSLSSCRLRGGKYTHYLWLRDSKYFHMRFTAFYARSKYHRRATRLCGHANQNTTIMVSRLLFWCVDHGFNPTSVVRKQLKGMATGFGYVISEHVHVVIYNQIVFHRLSNKYFSARTHCNLDGVWSWIVHAGREQAIQVWPCIE